MNDNIDYTAVAELFPASNARFAHVSYQRFDSVAEALRFAIEEMRPELLASAFLKVDGVGYSSPEIRDLYDAQAYPLARRAPQA